MRSHLWLLAVSGHLAAADWALEQKPVYAAIVLPRETRASNHDGANGWTPRPTEAPSVELARRRQPWMNKKRQDDNTWLNDRTCGWRADIESEPYTCVASETCSTANNLVGCTSKGGDSPFFTVCLDHDAYKASACDGSGPKTGCCQGSTRPACVTYIWPGATVRSMFMCGVSQSIVTLLSEPFFSSTSTSTTTTSTSTSTSTIETSTSTDDSSPVETNTGTPVPPPVAEEGGNNTGAIVGGVVGGIAGLALIAGAIAFFIIRQRKKEKAVGAGTAYSAVAPGDQGYQGAGGAAPPGGYPASSISPQMSQAGYFSPGSVGTTLQPESPYLHGNNPHPPVAGMYDPRQSYYDPAKMAEQQQQHHAYMMSQPGYAAPYPGAPPPHGGYPKPYAAPPHHVSELENTHAPAGHQTNPVEMAGSGPNAEMR